MSTWAYLLCFGVQHSNWDRTFLSSRWGSAANRTRTRLGLSGALLLEKHPKPKAKPGNGRENGSLWVDFSMCLIACMSRWWSWCGDGPVEVSCSVSFSVSVVGFCGWAAIGIFRWPAPAGAPGATPRGSVAPSTIILCRLAFSLASLVF